MRKVSDKLNAGDGWFRIWQVADGLVVPMKSGNADGGKEPWFTGVIRSDKTLGIGVEPINLISNGSEVTENTVCES